MTDWTEPQRQHIAWCATPKGQREPATQQEWAEQLGVNRRTLNRWEKLPGFWEEVRTLVEQDVLQAFPDILGALVKTASTPNTRSIVPAARLLLEMLGDLKPEGQTNVRIAFTADEFARAEAELDDWLASRPKRPSKG